MAVITTTIHIGADGSVSLAEKLPEGDYNATLIPAGLAGSRRSVLELPVHYGPWDDTVSLRREDMYGDDGR